MTNTKICPQCNQVNPLQAASCSQCGRQFKTTAPPGDRQDDPKTIVGSFAPNTGQQNYSQPNNNQQANFGQQSNFGQQADFGQQPNFNQSNFDSPFPNQPPKKSNTGWWIAGAILGVVLLVGGGVALIFAVVGYNLYDAANRNEEVRGSWRGSKSGVVCVFDSDQRFACKDPTGKSSNGTYVILNNTMTLKGDSDGVRRDAAYSIDGDTLTLRYTTGEVFTYQRIE